MRDVDAQQLFVRLHAALSRLGYMAWARVRRDDVFDGCPHTYADFLRFVLMRYSAATAQLMRTHTWLLIEDGDAALGASVLRLLSEAFATRLPLSPLQFAQRRFAAQKMHMCLCLLSHLRSLQQRIVHAATAASSSTTTVARSRRPPSSSLSLRDEQHAMLACKARLVQERRRYLNSLPRT